MVGTEPIVLIYHQAFPNRFDQGLLVHWDIVPLVLQQPLAPSSDTRDLPGESMSGERQWTVMCHMWLPTHTPYGPQTCFPCYIAVAWWDNKSQSIHCRQQPTASEAGAIPFNRAHGNNTMAGSSQQPAHSGLIETYNEWLVDRYVLSPSDGKMTPWLGATLISSFRNMPMCNIIL